MTDSPAAAMASANRPRWMMVMSISREDVRDSRSRSKSSRLSSTINPVIFCGMVNLGFAWQCLAAPLRHPTVRGEGHRLVAAYFSCLSNRVGYNTLAHSGQMPWLNWASRVLRDIGLDPIPVTLVVPYLLAHPNRSAGDPESCFT